ncbi:hypothetical protein BaRGS_00011608 [Batillaria attramentaria]|uniref:Uncharacterized protein n=1 Tax=Batillaria attramentaria TaxID=370345 RepID=A0ABD0LCC8_9CAEN
MGNNQVHVVNKTGESIQCISFNNSELIYKRYRSKFHLPVSGDPVAVDGLQGGHAVKVGIIFREGEGCSYYDLFQVEHGTALCINKISKDSGVTDFSPEGPVRLLQRGRSIGATAGI